MPIPFLHNEQKQKRKHVEHALFCLKYARRMKEDQFSRDSIQDLLSRFSELKALLKSRDYDTAVKRADEALELTRKLHPAPHGKYGLRENVEVFVVVLAVALGLRTYFLQPYQIPTGSMQPTVFGITGYADYEPDWTDRFPANLVKFALTGSRFVEVRARETGILSGPGETPEDTFEIFTVRGRPHRVHREFELLVRPGQAVRKGDVIARGLRKQGDFIVVNRLTTNFVPPRRGDMVVFSTRGVPDVRENSAYIKRLVGLPGETVAICDRYLVVNGERILEPDVFRRQMEDPGYNGYSHIPARVRLRDGSIRTYSYFTSCEAALTLDENKYLYFGDNTEHSLDGRFFGGVQGQNVIGIAFFVPWPFFNRGTFNETAGFVR